MEYTFPFHVPLNFPSSFYPFLILQVINGNTAVRYKTTAIWDSIEAHNFFVSTLKYGVILAVALDFAFKYNKFLGSSRAASYYIPNSKLIQGAAE